MASATLAAGRHPLANLVGRALHDRCGVSEGGSLLAAVSGGPDSVALLLLLSALTERGQLGVLEVACVHHHLRSEADSELERVRTLAAELGHQFHRLDVHPGVSGGSIAAQARDLRYQALADLAASRSLGCVAVAHHSDDQLETMLMALCRGTGVRGLAAMRPARPMGNGVTLVRPLLEASKVDLEQLCRACGVEWCEDRSNAPGKSMRGDMRHSVTAALDVLWPGAARRANRTSEALAIADMALNEMIDQRVGAITHRTWSRAGISALQPIGLFGLALARVVPEGFDAEAIPALLRGIQDREQALRRWHVGVGWHVVVSGDSVRLLSPVESASPPQGSVDTRQAS